MKKSVRFLLLPILFFQTSVLFSQEAQKQCGSDELRIQTLKQQPKVAQAVIQREAQLERFTTDYVTDFYLNRTNRQQKKDAKYIIPIVIHVIHNYGAENISEAQIKDGIDILNKTFRKQLSDTDDIVPAFQSIHADTEIEFRLATKDPQGKCTNGINRIASPLSNIGDHRLKSLIQWPPNKYLNIYISEDAAGLAGHCVWPSDADTIPEWDGIVVAHSYVGSIGTSDYTRSVALAHECGHYLNLHHIWGGNNVPGFYYLPCANPNKDCSIDDLVADTPPTIGWQTCNLSGKSCGSTLDNVQNVMDYSYCNRMFTFGQMARMHACLNSPIAGRNNLWQPTNLIATGTDAIPTSLCRADFTTDKSIICENSGDAIQFTSTSFYDPSATFSWSFPGGVPSTSTLSNPTVSYTNSGVYSATLKVSNTTQELEITKEHAVTVLSKTGNTYPFSEGFETTPSLVGPEWFAASLDTLNDWKITNSVGYNGTKSVVLNTNNLSQSTKDELISKVINLKNAPSNVKLNFKYAYTQKDSTNNDRFQVFFTKDCGDTWVQRLITSGKTLNTAPLVSGNFIPSNKDEWKSTTVSIPASYLHENFRFKFVFSSNGGNSFYIDDINVDMNAGVAENSAFRAISVFPNPTSDQLTVSLDSESSEEIKLHIVNALGQEVLAVQSQYLVEGSNQIQVPVSGLSPGLYQLLLEGNGKRTTKLFSVVD